jgi:hypothetical protein
MALFSGVLIFSENWRETASSAAGKERYEVRRGRIVVRAGLLAASDLSASMATLFGRRFLFADRLAAC